MKEHPRLWYKEQGQRAIETMQIILCDEKDPDAEMTRGEPAKDHIEL